MVTLLLALILGLILILFGWVFTLSRRIHDLESVAGLALLVRKGSK